MNLSKKILSSTLVIIFTLSCSIVSFAAEAPVVTQNIYTYELLPSEFDSDVPFTDIEKGIKDFISERNLEIEIGSLEYVDLMYAFLFNEVEDISDITLRYFADYASVYVVKVQEASLKTNPNSRTNTSNEYDIQIDGTIKERQQANSNLINSFANTSSNQLSTCSATFTLSRAQSYAEMYALSWNYVYGRYTSDCTNFASQILHYAGMPEEEGQWQWNGNDLAKRRWNVAHDFIEYWGLEKGYAYNAFTTKADVNKYAQPGDFMGYMRDDTYEIWHVAFVQSKVNGEIYISQHTTDRFNEKWNDITITHPSSYFINRFL